MRIAFFASSNGSTFQHLVETIAKEALPADPALLICSRSDAQAVNRAQELKIPSVVISRKSYASIEAHGDALLKSLDEYHCDFILLVGYLEFVPPQVIAKYRHRIVNIHPALLPAFGGKGMYGKHVHEAVIEFGARITGATVHFVDEEYDHGPIIAQQAIFVEPRDTSETLAQRVQAIEKGLYAGTLRLLASQRVVVHGRKVTLLP